MFRYDGDRLQTADWILVEAGETASSARIYAWRCLVRQIMHLERTDADRPNLMAEVDAFSRRAPELSKVNPLVLAPVGPARVMVEQNADAGSILARDAVALSPYNAHAYLVHSGALSRAGDNPAR